MKRCEPCLGLGYKGGMRNGKWKIGACRSCGGRGQVPETQRQRIRTHKPKKARVVR